MKNPLFYIIGAILYFIFSIPTYAYYTNMMTGSSSNSMPGINLLFLFIAIIVVVFIFRSLKRLFSSKEVRFTGLVLSKYSSPHKENSIAMSIEARKGGIWAFFMAKANIDNKLIFSVEKEHRAITCEISSIDGYSRTIIGINDIASMKFGHQRNLVMTIILGIIFVILMLGVSGWFFVGIIGSALWYWLTQSFILDIETMGGSKITLGFTTSLIENQTMNKSKAQEIQDIIFNLKNKA